jgi:O-antigen ligase
MIPDMATLVVMFALYSNAAIVASRYHGVPYPVAVMVPMLLVIPLVDAIIFRRQKIVVTPVLGLMVLLLVSQTLSTVLSSDPGTAMSELITFLLEGVVLYAFIVNVVRTPRMIHYVTWVLLAVGVFLGGLTLYQQLTGSFNRNFGGFAQASFATFDVGADVFGVAAQQPRLAGPLGDQNRYAQFMLMLVPLGMLRFWGERQLALRVAAVVATALSATGVALTFSRGAAVAFVLLLLLMALMRYIKLYQLGLVVVGVVVLLAVFPQYGRRISSVLTLTTLAQEDTAGITAADGATKSRVTEMMAAALVFADYPILGVGPGRFPQYYQPYAEQVGIKVNYKSLRQSHNLYLGVAAEYGILGLALFMAVLLSAVLELELARRRWEGYRTDLTNYATSYMLAILAYMMTGIFLHLAYQRYLWIMVALGGAVAAVAAEVGRSDPDSPPPAVFRPWRWRR